MYKSEKMMRLEHRWSEHMEEVHKAEADARFWALYTIGAVVLTVVVAYVL